MARSIDLEIKEKLLNACLRAVIKNRSLYLSVRELAKMTGTSARMIVYHFGSKAELDKELCLALDRKLQERFAQMIADTKKNSKFMLHLWDKLASDNEYLALSLVSISPPFLKHQKILQKAIDQETEGWISLLQAELGSRELALVASTILMGGISDMLMTGNSQRTREVIQWIQW